MISSVLRSVARVLRRLPLTAAVRVGAACGRIGYALHAPARRLALAHMEMAFGPGRDVENRRLARSAFENVGRGLAEMLVFGRIRPEIRRYVTVIGQEHLEAALAAGRGAIAVTGHIGNWELLAAAMVERGFPISVVGRKPREPAFFDMLAALRREYGAETIWRESDGSAKQILRTLKNNGVLALLIDQKTTRVPYVAVPFFGRRAPTPSGAAVLALRTGAALVPVFIHRTSTGHTVEFDPPIDPRSVRGEDPVVELTAVVSRRIEDHVRRRPDEWVWWHRRWESPGAHA